MVENQGNMGGHSNRWFESITYHHPLKQMALALFDLVLRIRT
jgi:hypothetical protein